MRAPVAILSAMLALPACQDPTSDLGPAQSVELGRAVFSYEGPRHYDILLVIDDSASMADEQETLALNLGAFIDVLESEEVKMDYRVMVVRTSGSNCQLDGQTDGQTDGGLPVAESCRARLEDFVVPEGREAGVADWRDVCLESCAHETLDIVPTLAGLEDTARPRPWLEHRRDTEGEGVNSPVPLGEALTCLGLVGVSGCDYESPFEAIARVLEQDKVPGSPTYGFLREDAHFLALVISDEDDCSLRDPSVLDPAGARVFWPPGTPSAETRAPSATCFRAGSGCRVEENRWVCEAVERAADGGPAGPGSGAAPVLHPVDELVQSFERLRQSKRDAGNHEAAVLLGLITGVDERGMGAWPLPEPEDADFVAEFGVAPGCQAMHDEQRAVGMSPPRLLALAEALTPNNAFSSCSNDYSPALEAIAEAIRPQLAPNCFPHTARLHPVGSQGRSADCLVFAEVEGLAEETRVPECVRDDEGGYQLDEEMGDYTRPPEAEVCFVAITDANGSMTPDPFDSMSVECVDQEGNLEFKFVMRPGSPWRGRDRRYEVVCSVDPEAPAPMP